MMSERQTNLMPDIDGRFKHRNGKVYCILALGKMEATGEEVVVYREWGSRNNPVWVRPYSEWWDKFEVFS